ncbi:predicted protein [Nematostella vectensis]|uniref:Pentraxin (PTX) domain-containing protein n=2 Tax=Nematostella vectensis TaxID=45351 RepID=A7SYW9_NEMVE|nr:predicted protein [Nematostella vectensis]|eukprot:XP_001623196.1 predicted protein [Nematostella vectensis]
MVADDDINPATILSYSTASNLDALSIGIKKDGSAEIAFGGAGATLETGFTHDNTWQHLVFLYGNRRFQVYKNNVLQEEKVVSGVAASDPAGSILVIGQHQGSLGGSFDSSKLFYGYMANLNYWGYAIDDWARGQAHTQGCAGSLSSANLKWETITVVGCVLHFATNSTSNFIQLSQPLAWFYSFTVTVWLKMGAVDNGDPAMILTYATPTKVDALTIGISRNGSAEITFDGSKVTLASGFTHNNTWQHLTFMHINGKFQVYKNNVLQGEKTVSGTSAPSTNGIVVIGQYQGSVGGNFDSSKLFYGYMANLNIWLYAINDDTRGKAHQQGCKGSVQGSPDLSWETITGETLSGDIQPQCAMTCP